jgi:hypothetical protein
LVGDRNETDRGIRNLEARGVERASGDVGVMRIGEIARDVAARGSDARFECVLWMASPSGRL